MTLPFSPTQPLMARVLRTTTALSLLALMALPAGGAWAQTIADGGDLTAALTGEWPAAAKADAG
ncbi:MAG: hypothetical protein KKB02_09980, partial [Alphaproteobacteria bacterium]|nr:hypothetical protein [Alphaproteobacteria bacterium]